MRKVILVLVLSLAVVFSVSARTNEGAFTKGSSLVGANFGMKAFVVPHFGLSYEYCILSGFYSSGRGSLGVGGYVGTTFGSLHAFNARVTLHNQFNNMDFYLGMLHGVNVLYTKEVVTHFPGNPHLGIPAEDKVITPASWNPHYGFDFFLGWRWAFNENWGMNVELSPLPIPWFSQPLVSAGANFKF